MKNNDCVPPTESVHEIILFDWAVRSSTTVSLCLSQYFANYCRDTFRHFPCEFLSERAVCKTFWQQKKNVQPVLDCVLTRKNIHLVVTYTYFTSTLFLDWATTYVYKTMFGGSTRSKNKLFHFGPCGSETWRAAVVALLYIETEFVRYNCF